MTSPVGVTFVRLKLSRKTDLFYIPIFHVHICMPVLLNAQKLRVLDACVRKLA